MPTKNLTTPFARGSTTIQRTYNFGGGAEIVFTADGEIDEFGVFQPFDTGYIIDTNGGDDIIYGSSFDDTLTGGDGSDIIYGGAGNDTLRAGNPDGSDSSKGRNPPPTNFLVGDGVLQGDGTYSANIFDASGTASNDTIYGGDGGSTNRTLGDYSFVSVAAGATFTGGMDTITGGDSAGLDIADNDIFGDGETVSLGAGSTFNGGDDTITGGFDAFNTIYGDSLSAAFSSNATFNGGDDILTGGDGEGPLQFNQNIIYGDSSGVIFTFASGAAGETFNGGDDTITGGDNVTNLLFGDVVSISNDGIFVGGNDTITGGSDTDLLDGVTPTNTMIGDASSFGGTLGSVTGGNDKLISGTNANDTMTGDFGADPDFAGAIGGDDLFVFAANNGLDTITDFELAEFDGGGVLIDAHDIVDLTAFGTGLDFAALSLLWTGDTITFSAGNTLTFTGLTEAQFAEEDFLFAVA